MSCICLALQLRLPEAGGWGVQTPGKKKQEAALLAEPLPPCVDAPCIANTLTKEERADALAWIEQRRASYPSEANLAARAADAAKCARLPLCLCLQTLHSC